MKKIIQQLYHCVALCCLLTPLIVQAQADREWLADLATEEEEAINALVLYPIDTRLAILEVSMYPEALIKVESIQTKTKAAFQSLLEKHPQRIQELIWDLTRYPALIDRLLAVHNGTPKDINLVLDHYPVIIHERAKEAIQYYSEELAGISTLNREAESAFGVVLANYPERTQQALKHLLDLPEVLSIMTDNIKLTVIMGDLYKNDPDGVLRQADSLNLIVARQQARELEDWKKSLEEDPQAREELEASAEAFGEEHGYYYDDDYYQYDEVYYEEREEAPEVHHYYYYHYPYWFAYPYWYAYPRWREYPYWYDWGFYYGPRHTVIVVGLPSFYFTSWYFYHPYHHYRWSYLSAHFTRHYYGHRKHGGSITAGVTVWQSRNREVVSDDWMRDDGRLADRFREFGKFEADRARYNRSHPQRELNQQEFRDRYSDRYRTITPSKEQTRTVQPGEEKPRIPTEVQKQPAPNTRDRKVAIVPRQRTEPEPKEEMGTPRSNLPGVQKGTDRHRSVSERNKTTTTRTVKPATPQTKAPRTTTSQPKSPIKKSTPRKKN